MLTFLTGSDGEMNGGGNQMVRVTKEGDPLTGQLPIPLTEWMAWVVKLQFMLMIASFPAIPTVACILARRLLLFVIRKLRNRKLP